LPRGCKPAPGLYCRERTGEAVTSERLSRPTDTAASFRLTEPTGPTGRAVDGAGLGKVDLQAGNSERERARRRDDRTRARQDHSRRGARADALVARHEPARRSRLAVRWLQKLLKEDELLSIEEAAVAASCLAALGGRGHQEALAALSAMAEKATRNARARRVAS